MKKSYLKPVARILGSEASMLICGSGSISATLGKGSSGGGTPQPTIVESRAAGNLASTSFEVLDF